MLFHRILYDLLCYKIVYHEEFQWKKNEISGWSDEESDNDGKLINSSRNYPSPTGYKNLLCDLTFTDKYCADNSTTCQSAKITESAPKTSLASNGHSRLTYDDDLLTSSGYRSPQPSSNEKKSELVKKLESLYSRHRGLEVMPSSKQSILKHLNECQASNNLTSNESKELNLQRTDFKESQQHMRKVDLCFGGKNAMTNDFDVTQTLITTSNNALEHSAISCNVLKQSVMTNNTLMQSAISKNTLKQSTVSNNELNQCWLSAASDIEPIQSASLKCAEVEVAERSLSCATVNKTEEYEDEYNSMLAGYDCLQKNYLDRMMSACSLHEFDFEEIMDTFNAKISYVLDENHIWVQPNDQQNVVKNIIIISYLSFFIKINIKIEMYKFMH